MMLHRLETGHDKLQILIGAMCCSHAELVCEQVKAHVDALYPGQLTVDWVGTGPNGRSDNENRAIIRKFCPEKVDGTRRPEDIKLDIKKYVDDSVYLVGTKGFVFSMDVTNMVDEKIELIPFLDMMLPVTNPVEDNVFDSCDYFVLNITMGRMIIKISSHYIIARCIKRSQYFIKRFFNTIPTFK